MQSNSKAEAACPIFWTVSSVVLRFYPFVNLTGTILQLITGPGDRYGFLVIDIFTRYRLFISFTPCENAICSIFYFQAVFWILEIDIKIFLSAAVH